MAESESYQKGRVLRAEFGTLEELLSAPRAEEALLELLAS